MNWMIRPTPISQPALCLFLKQIQEISPPRNPNKIGKIQAHQGSGLLVASVASILESLQFCFMDELSHTFDVTIVSVSIYGYLFS